MWRVWCFQKRARFLWKRKLNPINFWNELIKWNEEKKEANKNYIHRIRGVIPMHTAKQHTEDQTISTKTHTHGGIVNKM